MTAPFTFSGIVEADGAAANFGSIVAALNSIGGFFSSIPTPAEIFGASPGASPSVNTAAIQAALTRGNTTLLTPGVFQVACSTTKSTSDLTNTYSVALFIGSNTIFQLGSNTTLKIANGFTNPVLIQNSDIVNGNANITIIGGIWDGNRAGSIKFPAAGFDLTHTLCCITIWIQNVTNYRSRDMTIVNPLGWGYGVSNVTNGWFDNTYFNYSGGTMGVGNQGGFQFEGPNVNIFVRNTRGNTYDDLVAFVTVEDPATIVSTPMAGPGAAHDIVIDGVIGDSATGALELIRLQDNTSNPLSHVNISNVSGWYVECGIVIGLPNLTGFMKDVNMVNVSANQFGNTGTRPTINFQQTFDSVHIKNISRQIAIGETPRPLVRFDFNCNGSAVDVDGFTVTDAGQTTDISIFQMLVTTALTSLKLSNGMVRWNGSGASHHSLVGLNSGSGLSMLHVTNVTTYQIGRLVSIAGPISTGVFLTNIWSGSNRLPAIAVNASCPLIHMSNILFDGTQGGASGVINFNGSTGTTVIHVHNVVGGNGANANIVRAAAESIRVNGICSTFSVPNGILTEAVGDVFSDFTNSNNPYRCSVAPSTFVAL